MQLECESQITILKMYDGKLTEATDIQLHRRCMVHLTHNTSTQLMVSFSLWVSDSLFQQ